MSTTTVTPTRTLTALAVQREVNRRKKPRAERKRASSWVFGGLLTAQLHSILDGNVEVATFKGRTEQVGLRS